MLCTLHCPVTLCTLRRPVMLRSFYDKDAPIYTMSRFLPPSKVMGAGESSIELSSLTMEGPHGMHLERLHEACAWSR